MANLKSYSFPVRSFIPTCLGDADFQRDGYLVGLDGGIHYIVLDPKRHPMAVWKKRGDDDYDETAISLNAAAFTNGPQMEGEGISQAGMIGTTAGAGVGGAVVGGLIVNSVRQGATIGVLGGPKGIVIGAVVGLVIGAGLAIAYWTWKVEQTDFAPFGFVQGAFGSDDGSDYTTWAWFGVDGDGTDFATYKIARSGVVPRGLPNVSGGLIPLVIGWVAMSSYSNTPARSQEYEDFSGARGVAAWGLVPIHSVDDETVLELPAAALNPADLEGINVTRQDGSLITGVLVVAASKTANATMAESLQMIGARDAVAMDGNESYMMGTRGEVLQPEPRPLSWLAREELEEYGFYCR